MVGEVKKERKSFEDLEKLNRISKDAALEWENEFLTRE
jgi:hypothetical protein